MLAIDGQHKAQVECATNNNVGAQCELDRPYLSQLLSDEWEVHSKPCHNLP